jgi:hypothetical protein
MRKAQEDLAILRGRADEVLADALPDLKVLGTGTRYRDPGLLNSSSFDAFPPELRDSLTPVPANLFEGTAELRQTLFSFKLGKAIRAAKLARQMGAEEVVRARQATALVAVRAYNDYVLGIEKIAVGQKAVIQKEKHLEMAKNRRASGVATELDVLRSQVDLENQRAVLLRLRGEAELAHGTLNATMVQPIDTPIEPVDRLEYLPLEMKLDDAVREAWSRRPEAKAIALNERIYEQLIGVAQAEGRPSLDFYGQYGWSVRKPGNFFESDFTKWNAGVTLTIPVFDGFRTRGKGRPGARRAQQGDAGPHRPREPHPPGGEGGRRPPGGREERPGGGGADRQPGPARARDDPGQLPARRGHDARRHRRAGLADRGGVEPPARPVRARERPRRAPLRDRAGPFGDTGRAGRAGGRREAMRTSVLPVLAAAVLSACGGAAKSDPSAEKPKGVPVRTAPVQRRELADTLLLTGTLRPQAQIEVVAEVSARLMRVVKDEGSRVHEGDVLAVLDETDYR